MGCGSTLGQIEPFQTAPILYLKLIIYLICPPDGENFNCKSRKPGDKNAQDEMLIKCCVHGITKLRTKQDESLRKQDNGAEYQIIQNKMSID